MPPNQLDLPPFEIPATIYAFTTHAHQVTVLPDGADGFKVDVRWKSRLTGLRNGFCVNYSIGCEEGTLQISRQPDLDFRPYPPDYGSLRESLQVWRTINIEQTLVHLRASLGQYLVLARFHAWRTMLLSPSSPPEMVASAWELCEQAMTALLSEFPEGDHIFPIALPGAAFGMR